MRGGIRLHLCITEVDFEKGYRVILLFYEDIQIVKCLIWTIAMSICPFYNFMIMNISLSMSIRYG